MSDEELASLVTGPEGERLERKESLTADRVREAICAFANDLPGSGLPGVIAVGIDDGGTPVGLLVDDQLLLALSNMRDDGNIVPFPSMEVRKIDVHGSAVAVAIVEPSSSPPVAFRGRVWIRVGPRRAIASPEEERRLIERRRLANLPFDSRPLASAGLQIRTRKVLLGLDAADEHARWRGVSVGVGEVKGGHLLLNRATVLGEHIARNKLGQDLHPEQLEGQVLQFVRFVGATLADDVLSTHRLAGNVMQIMRDVDEVVRSNVGTRVVFAGQETERRRPDVPFEALQQLIRNALIHRSYEGTNAPVRVSWFRDRVEIQSPGGPFGQVTLDTFGDPGVTDYRNPALAGVLGQLGFVQRFGAGIAIARAALAKNGNPPLELVPTAAHVLAIVRFE